MSDIEEYHLRADILSRAKAQYEPGPMRPRLCEVFKEHALMLPTPKASWLCYAGMGDVDVNAAEAKYLPVIAKLRDEGFLVPTTNGDVYGVAHYRLLTHFDDVNWGRDHDGHIVIYNFNQNPYQPQFPDHIIIPDESHKAAVKQLEHRIHYGKTMEDDAVVLRSGSKIIPILTDRRVIDMRQRQKGIFPALK